MAIDPKVLESAKERYMNYENTAGIARSLGVAKSTLQGYVNKEWRAERELTKSEMFEDVAKFKKVQFVKLTENTIIILSRALENLVQNKQNITMREARDVASIMESLDKITRLDDNKPTDIIREEKVTTSISLQERLKADPFVIDEGDYSVKNITSAT